MHWAFAPGEVRGLVPPELELDLFAGRAWVSLAAFRVSSMRPTLVPPLPWLSRAEQINVRTYVHREGVPGLWFFSLDATNPVAVWAARLAYALPYHQARIRVVSDAKCVSFHAERTDVRAAPARLSASWECGESRPPVRPGTLESFLLERYVMYSGSGESMRRARIKHRPWPLRRASMRHLASTMLEAAGLPKRDDAPLVHAQGLPFDVGIWPPERLARRR